MEAPRWARVKGDINCSIRRGAWYQVVRLTSDAAILEVGQRSVGIPRELVQIVAIRPRRWSVVHRPYDAIDLPMAWGSSYAVCSNCRGRMPISRDQAELSCTHCGDTRPVDWSGAR